VIYPVILAGGVGSRLWPVSRSNYPKQFSRIFGSVSLFQQTASRFNSSTVPGVASPITVTRNEFRFIIANELQSIGIDPGAIIIEPEPKNTAPAIMAAALHIGEIDQNGIMVVLPSDHLIPDIEAFHVMLLKGIPSVEAGNLVTFGAKPTRPETGFGYIKSELNANNAPAAVTQFVEKPSIELAQSFVKSEQYLWNTGIFMFRAQDISDAITTFCPEIALSVSYAFQNKKFDLGFIRLEEAAWSSCPDISIDHAIMEKAQNVSVVPFLGSWSDLGNWDAVWEGADLTANGVSKAGKVITKDCYNSLLRSESENQQLVCIGLENIVVVGMNDAVLVANKDRVQDVKEMVQILIDKRVSQGSQLPKDYRPWGWFETFVISERFHIKQIFVSPNSALSLQSHKFRSEHWVIIEGTATVTLDDQTINLEAGQSIYIPCGSRHRLENSTSDPLELIEVQLGSYFGEDDILRHDDWYKRG